MAAERLPGREAHEGHSQGVLTALSPRRTQERSGNSPGGTTVAALAIGGKADADRRRRKAAVRVRCEGDTGSCAGAVRLRAGGKTLGTGRFELAAGAKRTIRVKLNRRARVLLEASGRTSVTLAIAYADGRTERVRVRLTR